MISLGKKEYERQRNALIPEAEKCANKDCGAKTPMGKKEKKEWAAMWNHYFHAKMNQLWEEKGEVNMGSYI